MIILIRVAAWLTACSLLFAVMANAAERLPNIVIIMADDLGYGDLSCYGHPTIRTLNLDRMAAEGMRFTDFYSGAAVCTPSRAALLTGRLPIRSGMASDRHRVLFPNSKGGLPTEELTIPEILKQKEYATACIGKWHLGFQPQFLPQRHGFDYYFGLPYSNDMAPAGNIPEGAAGSLNPKSEYWNVPLVRGENEIEKPADQHTLTRRYTDEGIKFIREHKGSPFFLYLPHTMPHVPLFASENFQGKSRRGLYGDVVEELDWSVGQILQAIRAEGLAENTIVFFTSDNGPWLSQKIAGGSAGLLREGKGSTWEGGMRVPAIAWWPGKIRAGQITSAIACAMDLFNTALDLAGAEIPKDRVIDGKNLAGVLFGSAGSIRDEFYYHRDVQLFAVRKGVWKAHFSSQSGYKNDRQRHDPPLLFNLEEDPSEQFDRGAQHPEILREIKKLAEQHLASIAPGENQLSIGINVLKPGSDGVLLLHAKDAVIHGAVVRYESEPNKNTIGYWMKKEDWVSWDFEITSPGEYGVEALQGCGPRSGGSEVRFSVGEQALQMTVQETKHFQDFIPRKIGTFKFDRPGHYALKVQPQTKPGAAVMDLRQVRLIPGGLN
jgi:arylsulfatase A